MTDIYIRLNESTVLSRKYINHLTLAREYGETDELLAVINSYPLRDDLRDTITAGSPFEIIEQKKDGGMRTIFYGYIFDVENTDDTLLTITASNSILSFNQYTMLNVIDKEQMTEAGITLSLKDVFMQILNKYKVDIKISHLIKDKLENTVIDPHSEFFGKILDYQLLQYLSFVYKLVIQEDSELSVYGQDIISLTTESKEKDRRTLVIKPYGENSHDLTTEGTIRDVFLLERTQSSNVQVANRADVFDKSTGTLSSFGTLNDSKELGSFSSIESIEAMGDLSEYINTSGVGAKTDDDRFDINRDGIIRVDTWSIDDWLNLSVGDSVLSDNPLYKEGSYSSPTLSKFCFKIEMDFLSEKASIYTKSYLSLSRNVDKEFHKKVSNLQGEKGASSLQKVNTINIERFFSLVPSLTITRADGSDSTLGDDVQTEIRELAQKCLQLPVTGCDMRGYIEHMVDHAYGMSKNEIIQADLIEDGSFTYLSNAYLLIPKYRSPLPFPDSKENYIIKVDESTFNRSLIEGTPHTYTTKTHTSTVLPGYDTQPGEHGNNEITTMTEDSHVDNIVYDGEDRNDGYLVDSGDFPTNGVLDLKGYYAIRLHFDSHSSNVDKINPHYTLFYKITNFDKETEPLLWAWYNSYIFSVLSMSNSDDVLLGVYDTDSQEILHSFLPPYFYIAVIDDKTVIKEDIFTVTGDVEKTVTLPYIDKQDIFINGKGITENANIKILSKIDNSEIQGYTLDFDGNRFIRRVNPHYEIYKRFTEFLSELNEDGLESTTTFTIHNIMTVNQATPYYNKSSKDRVVLQTDSHMNDLLSSFQYGNTVGRHLQTLLLNTETSEIIDGQLKYLSESVPADLITLKRGVNKRLGDNEINLYGNEQETLTVNPLFDSLHTFHILIDVNQIFSDQSHTHTKYKSSKANIDYQSPPVYLNDGNTSWNDVPIIYNYENPKPDDPDINVGKNVSSVGLDYVLKESPADATEISSIEDLYLKGCFDRIEIHHMSHLINVNIEGGLAAKNYLFRTTFENRNREVDKNGKFLIKIVYTNYGACIRPIVPQFTKLRIIEEARFRSFVFYAGENLLTPPLVTLDVSQQAIDGRPDLSNQVPKTYLKVSKYGPEMTRYYGIGSDVEKENL